MQTAMVEGSGENSIELFVSVRVHPVARHGD